MASLGKMSSSEGLFWSFVANDGLSVSISEPELVEGGLSPPPSKVYPGRKCYMVIVKVKGRGDYGGFGPTPGIAKRSAIMEACKSFPCNAINTDACFADKVSSSDSETEDSFLRVTKDSSSHSSLAPIQSPPNDEYVLNMVHDLAKRKGVEVKSEVILAAPEVGDWG